MFRIIRFVPCSWFPGCLRQTKGGYIKPQVLMLAIQSAAALVITRFRDCVESADPIPILQPNILLFRSIFGARITLIASTLLGLPSVFEIELCIFSGLA